MLTLMTAFGLMATFIYWFTFPYKVADFNNPMIVMNENKTVTRGEQLSYVINYCKYTDVMPELTKFFIDGIIYEMPRTPGIALKGCGNATTYVHVPMAIPPGTYTLKTVARYQVNPIRTISIVNYSEPFTVK